jgi:hypothetical protein
MDRLQDVGGFVRSLWAHVLDDLLVSQLICLV